MMLQDNSVGVNSTNLLGVAVLSTHREIESECIGANYIDVASLGTAQRVDSTIKWFVGAHLNGDSCVFAVNGNVIACSSLITINVSTREIIE